MSDDDPFARARYRLIDKSRALLRDHQSMADFFRCWRLQRRPRVDRVHRSHSSNHERAFGKDIDEAVDRYGAMTRATQGLEILTSS